MKLIDRKITQNIGVKNLAHVGNGLVKLLTVACQQDPPGWKISVQLRPFIATSKHLLSDIIMNLRGHFSYIQDIELLKIKICCGGPNKIHETKQNGQINAIIPYNMYGSLSVSVWARRGLTGNYRAYAHVSRVSRALDRPNRTGLY